MIGDLISTPVSPVTWGSVSVGDTAPEDPASDDLWGDTINRLWKRWTGTEWNAWGVLAQTPGFFGAFVDLTDQANVATTNTITFGTELNAEGVSITDGTDVTITNARTYNVQVSGHSTTVTPGTQVLDVWLELDGAVVACSGIVVPVVGSANWTLMTVVTALAGSVLKVRWHSSDAAMTLDSTAARSTPTRPAAPCVSLLITESFYNAVSIAP